MDAQLMYLPNPNVGVLNAKYLMEVFIVRNMPNSEAFFDDFQGYSGTVSATIATVRRAMDHLFRSYKISSRV